jgi:hypothetical protein
MMATATHTEPPAREMDAAEAFQTYPTLKASVEQTLGEQTANYDVSRLTAHFGDTNDAQPGRPTIVGVSIPRRSLPE